MLFREIIIVYCENCTKHINSLCEQKMNTKIYSMYISGFNTLLKIMILILRLASLTKFFTDYLTPWKSRKSI